MTQTPKRDPHMRACPRTWRVHWAYLYGGSIAISAAYIFVAVQVWVRPVPYPSVAVILVGGGFVWLALWRPKAMLSESELIVVNRIRTYKIPLEQISSPIFDHPVVTFEITNGKEIEVAAVGYNYWLEDHFPQLETRGKKFISCVLAAKNAHESAGA